MHPIVLNLALLVTYTVAKTYTAYMLPKSVYLITQMQAKYFWSHLSSYFVSRLSSYFIATLQPIPSFPGLTCCTYRLVILQCSLLDFCSLCYQLMFTSRHRRTTTHAVLQWTCESRWCFAGRIVQNKSRTHAIAYFDSMLLESHETLRSDLATPFFEMQPTSPVTS